MSRFCNLRFIKRLSHYFYIQNGNRRISGVFPKYSIAKGSKLFISTQIFCEAVLNTSTDEMNIDDGLLKALEEGDVAIIQLMDQLKDFVSIVSQEYRTCLLKQIEVIRIALNIGPFSETWDELPQYRTLADELNNELNNYMALFNIIGQMANKQSLIDYVSGSNNNLDTVSIKFKELELLVKKEFDENRKIERELLEIKRDSILHDPMV